MARIEEWFGLAGVAWLFGVQLVALAIGALRRRPALGRAARRRAAGRDGAALVVQRTVDAPPDAQLPAGRDHGGSLVPHT